MQRKLALTCAALLATSCTFYEVRYTGALSTRHPWYTCGGAAEPHCLRAFELLQSTHSAANAVGEMDQALTAATADASNLELSVVGYDRAIVFLALGRVAEARASVDGALKLWPGDINYEALRRDIPADPPAPPPPKYPPTKVANAANDAASRALPPLARLLLLGTRVDPSFHDDGRVDVSVLPLDAQNNAILDPRLYVEVDASCEVPFPISGAVSVSDIARPSGQKKPFHMGIDIDGSGSMASSDPKKLRGDAAKRFIDTVAKDFPKSEFALWEFSSDVRLIQDLTPDVERAKAGVRVTANGGTELHKSAFEALDYLEKHASPDFQSALLVLSDGMDNQSGRVRAQDVIAKARAKGVPIYAIGLGGGGDVVGHGFVRDLQDYANGTGGFFAYARGADALANVFDAMALSQSRGHVLAKVALRGTQKFPTDTLCRLDVNVHAGGQSQVDTVHFVVPREK